MSTEQATHPTQAGLDTTTGHGVDSFFYTEGRTDPWASRCVTILVDTIINHEQVLYPLWSRTVIENIEDRLLPSSFVEGSKHNLLKIVTKVSADEVRLPNDVLKQEFRSFTDWANANAQEVAGWVRYHRESPRIIEIHKLAKSTWVQADQLWKRRSREDLRQRTGLSDADLNFAYETFLRAIQYHHVLGESIPYVSHPLRNRAFGQVPIVLQHQDQWSWGRYFVELLNDERTPKDMGWLLGEVAEVRDLTRKYNATWYILGKLPRKEQMELLSTIAAESNLPAKLKVSTHKKIKLALGAGAVLGAAIPILGIVLGLGAVAVELWRGEVPGALGKVPIFKGQLIWPELFRKL
jgi:hypothetical protein